MYLLLGEYSREVGTCGRVRVGWRRVRVGGLRWEGKRYMHTLRR